MLKLRRRWYAPGLISLLGLYFFLPYASKKMEPEKKYALNINMPRTDRNERDRYHEYFSESSIEYHIRNKKKFRIILDNNEETNREKLNIILRKALELKYTNDTSIAIIAGLTDSTSYFVLVKLLDMCYAERFTTFAIVNRNFIIWHYIPPPPKKQVNEYPCLLCNDVISISRPKKEPPWIAKIMTHKKQVYLFSGWFLLATIATYTQWKRKQIPRT